MGGVLSKGQFPVTSTGPEVPENKFLNPRKFKEAIKNEKSKALATEQMNCRF